MDPINGVSIVICCYNSESRLAPTLEHIKKQVVSAGIPWEVIIVDNASTDNTAQTALDLWGNFSGMHLRVVSEPKQGLCNARVKGFQEAKYEFVSFVDDDNWLQEDWVCRVYTVMTDHPDVGACGGQNLPVFEKEPPGWFEKYQDRFAIGKQSEISGDVTWSRGYLWGAGLTVRKTAWQNLTRNGFAPILSDRKGKQLTSGGDGEICLALRLNGWRLRVDNNLQLCHFIPADRMDWNYFRRMMRGFGASSVGHDPYKVAIIRNNNKFQGRIGKMWLWKLRRGISKLASARKIFFSSLLNKLEGNDDVLLVEFLIGRITELIRKRDLYDEQVRSVANAKWNIVESNEGMN